MISDNNGAHLAWCNTLNGEEDVYYGRITVGVGIKELNNNINLSLSNYPNPFKEQTTISYMLSSKSNVRLVISDIYGKEIKTLVNKEEDIGMHELIFETKNLSGGIYYCKIIAGNSTASRSLVLIK